MADEEGRRRPVRHPATQLTITERIMAGAVGLAGFGGGTTATFMTRNSAASGVMLAIGAVFALLSITGSRPRSLRIGDSQLDLLDETLITALQSPEPETRIVLAEQIVEERAPVSEPVRVAARAVLYEHEVLQALAEIGATVLQEAGPGDQRFDAIVNYKGHRVGVEIVNAKNAVQLQRAATRAASVASGPGWMSDVVGLLFVTPFMLGKATAIWMTPKVQVAIWESHDDNVNLSSTLNKLISDSV